MNDKIVPTVEVVPIVTDGVHLTLSVPTYDGDKLFTLTCERDSDGDWRVDFSAPEDHEAENIRVGAAAGTYRLGAPETGQEDAVADADRQARPWTVGEVKNPGVIERFATHDEGARYISETFDAADVEAGRYYLDGPEPDATPGMPGNDDDRYHGTAVEPETAAIVKEALEGDSNDAEHDALIAVADELGIPYTIPED